MRLTTGFTRGAAMTEPYAGVNVCLLGQDGKAILHRISPVNDPTVSKGELEEICQVRVCARSLAGS